MNSSGDRAELAEMLEYHRARAGGYDEWFERRGRFDRGDRQRVRWSDCWSADIGRTAENFFDGAARAL